MSGCTVLREKQNQARAGLQERNGAEQNPGLLAISGAVGKVDHLFRRTASRSHLHLKAFAFFFFFFKVNVSKHGNKKTIKKNETRLACLGIQRGYNMKYGHSGI